MEYNENARYGTLDIVDRASLFYRSGSGFFEMILNQRVWHFFHTCFLLVLKSHIRIRTSFPSLGQFESFVWVKLFLRTGFPFPRLKNGSRNISVSNLPWCRVKAEISSLGLTSEHSFKNVVSNSVNLLSRNPYRTFHHPTWTFLGNIFKVTRGNYSSNMTYVSERQNNVACDRFHLKMRCFGLVYLLVFQQ